MSKDKQKYEQGQAGNSEIVTAVIESITAGAKHMADNPRVINATKQRFQTRLALTHWSPNNGGSCLPFKSIMEKCKADTMQVAQAIHKMIHEPDGFVCIDVSNVVVAEVVDIAVQLERILKERGTPQDSTKAMESAPRIYARLASVEKPSTKSKSKAIEVVPSWLM